MSERTLKLKEKVVFKNSIVNKVKEDGSIVAEMARGSRLSLERAKLVTEAYKNTEGEPTVIRRAKSLAHVLENMFIYINDGELIVGNYSPSSRDIPFDPELSYRHLSMALDSSTGDQSYRQALTDKDRKEYQEIVSYWKDKALYDRGMKILPKRLLDYTSYNGVAWSPVMETYNSLETINIPKLLDAGLNGIIEQIEDRLVEIEADEKMPAVEYITQRQNLEAMAIAARAGIAFSHRYAKKARELASMEKDPVRKEELLEIAEICDWVPGNPARTLHEAIQSYYFCLIICTQIENPHGVGGGIKIDSIMNPFYQKDLEAGNITREKAQELVECLLVKIADHTHLFPPGTLQSSGGGISVNRDLTIGGVTSTGEDATNEFSFITLDAANVIRLPEPTIALRYHPDISEDLLSRAVDVVKTGVGYPAFYNDLAYIPWYESVGFTTEEARNYNIAACVGAVIQGENCSTHHAHAGTINLSKSLELALYRGKDKDKYTGKQLGIVTPDLRKAKSIEDVLDAYYKQVGHLAGKLAEIDNIRTTILEEYLPRPFSSALINGCIEKGKHSLNWVRKGSERIMFTGASNVVNSIAAIKKFVFDEKLITIEDLIEACRTNFEGKEDLRQTLINKAPKFGNDDDYVDKLAVEIFTKSNEVVGQSAKDRSGFPYYLDASIAGGYFAASTNCGAIPDGKKDSEPTADGSLSPSAGSDRKGPTAVINSAGKIPYTYPHLLNQKFLPRFLSSDNKNKFIQYLKVWGQKGIGHIQFNVVDKATLLDAQAHPENYTNLIVRVAGYSAYFLDLAKALQDDIIRRVEQEF